MSGHIDVDDSKEGGGGWYSVRAFSTGGDAPTLDPDLLVDRLRSMGLDRNLVDEADRRLRADGRTGMRWLQERLAELAPVRTAPVCRCGEPLVDVAWRGRATVRCELCGSRWGLDVDDDTESLWWISGPTPAWLQEQPQEEFDEFGDFQPDDVLRDGVPRLPAGGIEPGALYPLATWHDDRDGAVLYVVRRELGPLDRPEDEYEDETQHLIRGDDGEWSTAGSGGATWVNVFDPPVDLLDRYVVLGTGITGTGGGSDAVWFTGGLCSRAVATVEAIDGHGTRTYPVDPEHPIFVVGVRGDGQVRFRDDQGRLVLGPGGEPLLVTPR